MNKVILKRIIFTILIIVNCLVIFKFSSQNADTSSQTSGVVVNKIVDKISNANKNINKEKLTDDVTFVVRKCAHLSIYTLLGIWLMNLANTFNLLSKRNRIVFCIIFGMMYAASDELHQKFVDGRSAEIRDVCIDTCGVILGILLVILVGKIIKNIKTKKAEKLDTKS